MPEPVQRVRDHATGDWRPVRELDPAGVQHRRGGRLAPTRYVADRLIVRGLPDTDEDLLVDAVRDRAAARGFQVTEERLPLAPSRAGDNPLGPRPGVALQLDAEAGDVWDLLDEVIDSVDDEQRGRISLDHVVVAHQRWEPHGTPGGRAPATFLGAAPRRAHAAGVDALTTADGVRRPVVAVLDSGIGDHPWFDEPSGVVLRGARVDGEPLGTAAEDEPLYDAEVRGRRRDRVEVLDTYAGHGTFVAGVVHQVCPDAVILPVRIFGGDGRVSEWDVARTCEKILEYHLRGVAGENGGRPVDVVVLSGGFYTERPQDDDYDGVLRGRLRDLRQAGVLVVVSAGNDASSRPMFPAAWAPHLRRTAEGVIPLEPTDVSLAYTPLLAVTAANPDGSLADFANDGPWVTAVRPGARVVSTMPVTFDGTERPWTSGDGLRSTVDPDNFSGGFGTWSGTSFAAPVLAGELAAALLAERAGDGPTPQHTGAALSSRVRAAWAAVARVEDLYSEVPTAGS